MTWCSQRRNIEYILCRQLAFLNEHSQILDILKLSTHIYVFEHRKSKISTSRANTILIRFPEINCKPWVKQLSTDLRINLPINLVGLIKIFSNSVVKTMILGQRMETGLIEIWSSIRKSARTGLNQILCNLKPGTQYWSI